MDSPVSMKVIQGFSFDRITPGIFILAFMISMHMILCVQYYVPNYAILTSTYPNLHHRQKENNGQAHKVYIALLLMGFMMVALCTCSYIAATLVLVKFGLAVSLPGGLMAQVVASNLKSIIIDIIESWSGDFLVNSA